MDRAKRTVKVLARVILHRELGQVINDIAPDEKTVKAVLEDLAKENLTFDDPELVARAREHLTPDEAELVARAKEHQTPDLLYGDEAAAMLGQLSLAIFVALAEKDNTEADSPI